MKSNLTLFPSPDTRDSQILTDFLSEKIGYFSVPWNSSNFAIVRIRKYGMAAPFSQEVAAGFAKITNQLCALHATTISCTLMRIFSRSTGASCFERRARSSKIRARASCKFARASFFVRPCVFAPGNSSIHATTHFPCFLNTAVNSRFIYPKCTRKRMKIKRIGKKTPHGDGTL